MPFDERLLEISLHRTLALRLFEKRHLILVQAAKLAGLNAEEFVVPLGEAGIPAADYPAGELDEEVRTASCTESPACAPSTTRSYLLQPRTQCIGE